jgi:hypothetical protein
MTEMTERELQCFDGIGRGRWGEEHSKVLAWADAHPLPLWKDPNVDGMPEEEGQYLVAINGMNDSTWLELCYHSKGRKSFTTWDAYSDCEYVYKRKDVKYWMKIPDYK